MIPLTYLMTMADLILKAILSFPLLSQQLASQQPPSPFIQSHIQYHHSFTSFFTPPSFTSSRFHLSRSVFFISLFRSVLPAFRLFISYYFSLLSIFFISVHTCHPNLERQVSVNSDQNYPTRLTLHARQDELEQAEISQQSQRRKKEKNFNSFS